MSCEFESTIHRGAAEIGGNCIEVEASDGRRVVLDIGRPLWANGRDQVPLPDVDGLDGSGDTLVGVVISHPHLDHYGLLGEISPSVPVFAGREKRRRSSRRRASSHRWPDRCRRPSISSIASRS
ncbi:MAG: MBL fold metallo-hydrolase [Gaiellales bacterium]